MHIPSAKPPIFQANQLHSLLLVVKSSRHLQMQGECAYKEKNKIQEVLMFQASSSQNKSGNLNILTLSKSTTKNEKIYTHLNFPKVKIEQQKKSLLAMDKYAFTIWNIMTKKVLFHLRNTNMIPKHIF